MTGRTNTLSSMETYVSVTITNFASFTAYYNDGESSTQSPVQVKKDSLMFVNIDLGGRGPIPTVSGDVSIVKQSTDRYGSGYLLVKVSGNGKITAAT